MVDERSRDQVERTVQHILFQLALLASADETPDEQTEQNGHDGCDDDGNPRQIHICHLLTRCEADAGGCRAGSADFCGRDAGRALFFSDCVCVRLSGCGATSG